MKPIFDRARSLLEKELGRPATDTELVEFLEGIGVLMVHESMIEDGKKLIKQNETTASSMMNRNGDSND